MDRRLYAHVKLDVTADVVRIDVRGSLNEQSRPSLVHVIRRVRRMGIRSHIRVDLSRAAIIESSALAGLRNDLNSIDGATFPGSNGAGVSLDLTAWTEESSTAPRLGERPLDIAGGLTDVFEEQGAGGDPAGLGELGARPLSEYSDDELLAASDSIFSLLDSPEAFAGSDLLARYNDIGEEISRRNPSDAVFKPAAGEAAS
ncbi:hypothetical protein M1E17_03265 [Arthrobacter sp. D1-29]